MFRKSDVRYHARAIYLSVRRTLSTALIDRRRGIDTAHEADLSDLGAAHPERVRYEPTSWLELRRALGAVAVGPDDVFLDYGCGKGRVLLAAARRPFKRVLGVDISPQLCDVARANLKQERSRRCCGAVEVIATDVTEWEVPDDVTVAFMHNPFRGETFEAAINQLLSSVDRNPRAVHLIYRIPMEKERLLAIDRVHLVRVVPGLRPGREWSRKMATHVYRLQPADRALR